MSYNIPTFYYNGKPFTSLGIPEREYFGFVPKGIFPTSEVEYFNKYANNTNTSRHPNLKLYGCFEPYFSLSVPNMLEHDIVIGFQCYPWWYERFIDSWNLKMNNIKIDVLSERLTYFQDSYGYLNNVHLSRNIALAMPQVLLRVQYSNEYTHKTLYYFNYFMVVLLRMISYGERNFSNDKSLITGEGNVSPYFSSNIKDALDNNPLILMNYLNRHRYVERGEYVRAIELNDIDIMKALETMDNPELSNSLFASWQGKKKQTMIYRNLV